MAKKYVIFKLEDWEEFAGKGMGEGGVHDGGNAGIGIQTLMEREVSDGEVIRKKDVFAPPALYVYANSISAAVSVLENFAPHVADKLLPIADHFAEAAEESAHMHRNIPD